MRSVPASYARVRRAFVQDIVLRFTRAISAAQRSRNIDGRCPTAATHTHNQWLIANMSKQVCWCPATLWRDVTDLHSASYVLSGRGCTMWDHDDGLTKNRTVPRLFTCQHYVLIVVNKWTSESDIRISLPQYRNIGHRPFYRNWPFSSLVTNFMLLWIIFFAVFQVCSGVLKWFVFVHYVNMWIFNRSC